MYMVPFSIKSHLRHPGGSSPAIHPSVSFDKERVSSRIYDNVFQENKSLSSSLTSIFNLGFVSKSSPRSSI